LKALTISPQSLRQRWDASPATSNRNKEMATIGVAISYDDPF
jgi:hypothetical protein